MSPQDAYCSPAVLSVVWGTAAAASALFSSGCWDALCVFTLLLKCPVPFSRSGTKYCGIFALAVSTDRVCFSLFPILKLSKFKFPKWVLLTDRPHLSKDSVVEFSATSKNINIPEASHFYQNRWGAGRQILDPTRQAGLARCSLRSLRREEKKIKKPASLLPFIESQNWTSYYLKRGANNAHSFSCKNKFLGPSRSLELSNLLEFGMEIQHLILSWTLLCRPPSPVSRSTTPRALLQTNKVFCVVCIK